MQPLDFQLPELCAQRFLLLMHPPSLWPNWKQIGAEQTGELPLQAVGSELWPSPSSYTSSCSLPQQEVLSWPKSHPAKAQPIQQTLTVGCRLGLLPLAVPTPQVLAAPSSTPLCSLLLMEVFWSPAASLCSTQAVAGTSERRARDLQGEGVDR